MKGKRGVFFSGDALIALSIILLVLLAFYPVYTNVERNSKVHHDALDTLSSITVGETDNSYVKSLVSSGVINNTNNSLLEQIGEFFVADVDMARQFTGEIFSELDLGNENLGIWYENTLIYSQNKSPIGDARKVDTTRQIISGLREGESVTGFSARASLSSSLRQGYYYFGGYVGDGNISLRVEYNGEIDSSELEVAINNDFDIYVNGFYAGSYQMSVSEFEPSLYTIPVDDFVSGVNVVEFRGEDLHIAGGFLKIVYESDVQYEQTERYYFPGINGLINLYDGFYVPSELEEMSISLHLDSSQVSAFLNIGNVTVFNSTTSGEDVAVLDDVFLSSVLDYSSLYGKTIPIRLGLENVSFVVNATLDLISVSDLSKSMACSVAGGNCGNGPSQCSACGGTWLLPLDKSKEAHYLLIEEILGISFSRVGIRGYHVSVPASASQALSNDSALLNSVVSSWDGTTLSSTNRRLCLAIQEAVADFQANSDDDTIKVVVVMSAGDITHGCSDVTAGDLNLNGVANDPGDKAIKVSCDAHLNYGIVFHSVGYGSSADAVTLQKIAECGGGTFYSSDIEGLPELYQDIVNEIITEYSLQTLEANPNVYSRLYEDSYIEFEYNKTSVPFGLIITSEKLFSDAFSGSFNVPSDVGVLDVRTASYSGPRWTDSVSVNGNNIYRLSDYGSNYISLGDPYFINVPVSLVTNGTNYVNLTTGVSPLNSSSGSASNKIIYTVVKNASSFSPILASAYGCFWNIEFEDGSFLNAAVPPTYSGTDNCFFNSTLQDVANSNDALQVAVLELLQQVDLDSDGKIDISFGGQELQVSLNEIQGIPFTWSTEVQARVWY